MLRRAASDDQGPFFGMEFIQLTPPQYKLIANLLYRDASVFEDFRQRRRNAKNVLLGTLRFATWSLRYTMRAVLLAMRKKQPDAVKAPEPEPALPEVRPQPQPAAAYPPASQGVGGMSASVPHSMGQPGMGAKLSLAPAGGVRQPTSLSASTGGEGAGEASGGAVVATLANFW